jgi:uncharacterized membrane protein
MSDAAAEKPRLPRRLRWLLIGSLTLNLLVVGVVAGVALRFAGGDRLPPPAERSLGFGPWSGGLERQDYRALRRGFEAAGTDLRSVWREERADRQALVAALRAEPFDAAALDAVAGRMQARTLERLALGQRLIRDHVLAMSPAERAAFADRLDRSLRRHRDKDEDRPRN